MSRLTNDAAMTMRITFRVDASLLMGSGHVMRCLTLADGLAARGAECHFISREHSGHALALIAQRGFAVTALPVGDGAGAAAAGHAAWLGCDWQSDAQQTGAILASVQSDWLVVDHYALDRRWEQRLRPHCKRLMVLDDLADRPHDCDLLLDQNLGRQQHDYAALVPPGCRLLAGPDYALLRPEFAALRGESLARRADPQLRQVLVTMGGVDLADATSRVLATLAGGCLAPACRVTVVMGASAPWLNEVRELAARMPCPTEVLVNISDMDKWMAASDLAIGAGGSTSWERCCLGVPTLLVVLAENQRSGAHALQAAGAAYLIGDVDQIGVELPLAIAALRKGSGLKQMSAAAAAVTEGLGVAQVLQAMELSHG